MTSSLLAPKCRGRSAVVRPGSAGSTAATPVLDLDSPEVRALAAPLGADDTRSFLKAAHERIVRSIRAVYAVEDLQPASVTIRRGRGSCSQRLAVLEAVARSAGIATRVRGIEVDGAFWYPRFPRWKALVPDTVVLAWP